ncbi:unnamed protein product, partial [Mesorhabditis spiculigera]
MKRAAILALLFVVAARAGDNATCIRYSPGSEPVVLRPNFHTVGRWYLEKLRTDSIMRQVYHRVNETSFNEGMAYGVIRSMAIMSVANLILGGFWWKMPAKTLSQMSALWVLAYMNSREARLIRRHQTLSMLRRRNAEVRRQIENELHSSIFKRIPSVQPRTTPAR